MHDHLSLKADVTIGILGIILLLTLLFETIHHKLLHHFRHAKYLLVILDAFTRVLTVLGFLGFFLFGLIYTGLATYINDKIWGPGLVELIAKHELLQEGESPNFAPTKFAELVEDMHVSIFVTMLIYVFLGCIAMVLISRRQRKLHAFEIMDYEKIQSTVRSHNIDRSLLQNWIFRLRFLHPPSSLRHKSRHPYQFSFAEYLLRCEAENVSKFLRISTSTWCGMLLLLVLCTPIILWTSKAILSLIAVALSCFALMTSVVLWEQFSSAVEELCPSSISIRHAILENTTEEFAYSQIPTQIPLDCRPFIVSSSQLRRILEGTSFRNSQECTLPFGSAAREYMLLLMQFLTFLQVTLVTFSITRVMDPWWQRELISSVDIVTLLLPGIIAACTIVTVWPPLIQKFTLATSLEHKVNTKVIDEMDSEIARKCFDLNRRVMEAIKALSTQEQHLVSAEQYSLFASVPEKTRIQLMRLHKLLVDSSKRHKIIRILNIPKSLEYNFLNPNTEEKFIGSLVTTAYPLKPKSQRDLWNSIFNQLDTDRDDYVFSVDIYEALKRELSLKDIESFVRNITDVGYLNREVFLDYFTTDYLE